MNYQKPSPPETKIFSAQGFLWEIESDVEWGSADIWGPLCPVKKCKMVQLEQYETMKYRCPACGFEAQTTDDSARLMHLAQQMYAGSLRADKPIIKLDDMQSVNEKVQLENQFYSIAVEHDQTGKLKDVHVLIGRKDSGGKKAHIIFSPDGEVRFDRKDLHPSEEVKHITYVTFES